MGDICVRDTVWYEIIKNEELVTLIHGTVISVSVVNNEMVYCVQWQNHVSDHKRHEILSYNDIRILSTSGNLEGKTGLQITGWEPIYKQATDVFAHHEADSFMSMYAATQIR